MKKPRDWWGNPDNSKLWIEQVQRRENQKGINTTLESQKIVISEIAKEKFNKILEVGAGNGRLIGNLKGKGGKYSLDINKELSSYVKEKYPHVKTKVGDIVNLPYKDNEFDLVFTYQVLQHVPPENIKQALKELQRVAKNVWMWEGIGRVDYKHGAQTHTAHNGSWVWHIEEICEFSIAIHINKNIDTH